MVHLQLLPLNFIYENSAVLNKQTYNKALNRETPLINYIERNDSISIGAHLKMHFLRQFENFGNKILYAK